jgi:hypothetical protein
MKKAVVMGLVFLIFGTAIGYGESSSSSALVGGMRYHAENGNIPQVPFQDGDLSYLLAYEYHEDIAFWQIACGYAPGVGGDTNKADYVITPQINLIFKDGYFRGGVGALKSYMQWDDRTSTADKWSPFYWQVMLGLGVTFPASLTLSAYVYYPFKRFSDFNNFDAADLEFAAFVGLSF